MGSSLALLGCFDSRAEVWSKKLETDRDPDTPVAIGNVSAGDRIRVVKPGGEFAWETVIFAHTHSRESSMVKLYVPGVVGGFLGLSGRHRVPLASPDGVPNKNGEYAAARTLLAGSKVIVDSGAGESRVGTVARIWEAKGEVRYVVTDGGGDILAGGIAAGQQSTQAGFLETAGFRFLHWLAPGCLQWKPITSAISLALDSPLLEAFEWALDVVGLPPCSLAPSCFDSRAIVWKRLGFCAPINRPICLIVSGTTKRERACAKQ
jgi:hypothetical protein